MLLASDVPKRFKCQAELKQAKRDRANVRRFGTSSRSETLANLERMENNAMCKSDIHRFGNRGNPRCESYKNTLPKQLKTECLPKSVLLRCICILQPEIQLSQLMEHIQTVELNRPLSARPSVLQALFSFRPLWSGHSSLFTPARNAARLKSGNYETRFRAGVQRVRTAIFLL